MASGKKPSWSYSKIPTAPWRLDSFSPSGPRIMGTWPYSGMAAPNASSMEICRAVLLTWSSPRITWVIFHVPVIHHHAEVVGRCAIRAGDDQIIQLLIGDGDGALDEVIPGGGTHLGAFETHHR